MSFGACNPDFGATSSCSGPSHLSHTAQERNFKRPEEIWHNEAFARPSSPPCRFVRGSKMGTLQVLGPQTGSLRRKLAQQFMMGHGFPVAKLVVECSLQRA